MTGSEKVGTTVRQCALFLLTCQSCQKLGDTHWGETPPRSQALCDQGTQTSSCQLSDPRAGAGWEEVKGQAGPLALGLSSLYSQQVWGPIRPVNSEVRTQSGYDQYPSGPSLHTRVRSYLHCVVICCRGQPLPIRAEPETPHSLAVPLKKMKRTKLFGGAWVPPHLPIPNGCPETQGLPKDQPQKGCIVTAGRHERHFYVARLPGL